MKTKRILTMALCLLMLVGAIIPVAADDIVTTTPTYAAKLDFEDGILQGVAGTHSDKWHIRTNATLAIGTEGEGETANKYLKATGVQYLDFFAAFSKQENGSMLAQYGISGDKFVFSYDLRMVGVRAGQMRLFNPYQTKADNSGIQETFMYHMSGDEMGSAVFYKQNYVLDQLDYPNLPTLDADTWYTLAFAVDLSTNTCDFYIDGRLVAEDDPMTTDAGATLERIRTGMWGCADTEINFDNVKLYAAETPDYVNNTPLVPPVEEGGDENNGEENNNSTNTNTNNNTGKKDQTTETKAPETTAATEAETEAEESGCGAAVGMMAIPMALTMGAALVIKKKRK